MTDLRTADRLAGRYIYELDAVQRWGSGKFCTPICYTELPLRVHGRLHGCGIFYVGDLVQYSREEIACLKGMGAGSMKAIDNMLDRMGLRWEMRIPSRVFDDAATAMYRVEDAKSMMKGIESSVSRVIQELTTRWELKDDG